MSAEPDRRPATRLGRVVRTTAEGAVSGAAAHRETHRRTNWLRDVILGGQDGLVNILGIILGVIAGGGSETVLIVAGFAAAITESISMGAVGYTSSISERDYYLAEQARESAEITATPEVERQEIRDIYATKGFTGPLLEDVVSTITANRETWLATMMDEELHLQPVENRAILRAAIVIGIATLIGHLIPLVPFLVLDRTTALIVAIALSALALFAVGVYSAVTLIGDWRTSGARMVVIGLGAAVDRVCRRAPVQRWGVSHGWSRDTERPGVPRVRHVAAAGEPGLPRALDRRALQQHRELDGDGRCPAPAWWPPDRRGCRDRGTSRRPGEHAIDRPPLFPGRRRPLRGQRAGRSLRGRVGPGGRRPRGCAPLQ